MGCANCAIAQGGHPPVYLCVQVKDATSNRWHGVGTQCILVAIEEKSLDRKPQATIKIGDQTYKVNSPDLELEKFKAMEAGNALEVGDGAYRSDKAQPLQRRNSEPFGRRSHDRSNQTLRASSLPISSSRRKPRPNSPRSIGSVKDMRTDDDIMGDTAVAETIRRGEMMNDIVTTNIDPEFDERELSLEMQRTLSRDRSTGSQRAALGSKNLDRNISDLEERFGEIDFAIESTDRQKHGWSRSPPGSRGELQKGRQELQGNIDELKLRAGNSHSDVSGLGDD